MRTFAFLAAALTIAPGVVAVDQMKSFIIWTNKTSVTDAMIQGAKNAIIAAKGQITHTYNMEEFRYKLAPRLRENMAAAN